jgi:hypothetical protein
MSTMTQPMPQARPQTRGSFHAEIVAQWDAALAAQRAAEDAGDVLLAELMVGRLDDLRDLAHTQGLIPGGPTPAG